MVKNITINGSYFSSEENGAAAIAGSNEGTIIGCVNNSLVVGDRGVAGIARANYGTIEQCGNTVDINGVGSVSMMIGGIAGNNHGTIRNCWNTGAMKAYDEVGGIVGLSKYSEFLCGDTDVVVENCWSTGAVEGSLWRNGGVVGLAAGELNEGDSIVRNCYSLTEPVGSTSDGSGRGTVTNTKTKTTDQFASGEVTWLLNGSKADGVWKQTIGTHATPNFSGQTVYYGYTSCAEGAEKVYTNGEVSDQPKHDWVDGVWL